MTGERRFLDSNILVYLFDEEFPQKQARARTLIADGVDDFVLSVQVLGEFFNVVTRKIRHPLAPERALQATDEFGEFEVWPIHRVLVRNAMERSIASRLSYWEALIVETALEARATVLLTEDLQHGQAFGDVRVWNPFRSMEN